MSLLIKGAQIVDGSGREPFKGDVLIQKGVITAVGDLRGRNATKVVEGLGHYLTPGFIDIHARSDHTLSLFTNPEQEAFLSQGVTTILGGQHGASLAPIMYGSIESVRKWSDSSGFNINWNSVDEFLTELRRFKLGINFGTLAGHTTVRRDIVGERKTLGKNEAKVLEKILKDSIKQGAFGVSSGLGHVHGSFASTKEVAEVSGLVKSVGGVHVVGLRDIRSGYKKPLSEAIQIAEKSKAKLVIDDFRPLKGMQKEFKEALDEIDRLSEKLDIRFIAQARLVSERHIYDYLPKSFKKGRLEEMLAKVKKGTSWSAVEKEWRNLDFRSMRIVSAPKHHFLAGKSVVDVANNWDISYMEALRKLMIMTEMQAIIAHEDINRTQLRNTLSRKSALITADMDGATPGGGVSSKRDGLDSFETYIRTVLGEGVMSLEDAVAKITSGPAKFFNIPDRGLIEEGKMADLVLLGKDDYKVRQVFLGGKIYGEERLQGEVLRKRKY